MKIIKDIKDWVLVERCTGNGNGYGGCKVNLLIDPSDLYFNITDFGIQSLVKEINHISFCCPICGVETDVDNRVPYEVIHYMKVNGNLKKIKQKKL